MKDVYYNVVVVFIIASRFVSMFVKSSTSVVIAPFLDLNT